MNGRGYVALLMVVLIAGTASVAGSAYADDYADIKERYISAPRFNNEVQHLEGLKAFAL